MRLPMTARSRVPLYTMLAAAGTLLVGCAGEATAPIAQESSSQQLASPFQPTAAQKSLVGVTDGVYSFTVDPSEDQSITLGANRLELPANSICRLTGSGYGPKYWDDDCKPERKPVTITAIVKDAATDHPSIDFYPAMRFNPDTDVSLYIYVPTGINEFAKKWVMMYCNERGKCIDEARGDRDLKTFVDRDADVVFRRIKHFSGYVVAERGFADDAFLDR